MKKIYFTLVVVTFALYISYSQTIKTEFEKHQNSKSITKLNIDSLKNIKEPFPVVLWSTNFDPWEDTCYFNNNCSMWGYNKIGPFNVPGNLWQTGRPLKPYPLDTTVTPPNVLITDTLNPYPINSNSSFELHFGRWPGYENLCWKRMIFSFNYKIDADSSKDGIYVEIMYNGSNQWKNIIFDNMADIMQFDYECTYFPTDTLFNGEPGISFARQVCNPQDWNYFGIEWFWENENSYLVDSVAFRITFVSDSINTNKGGVLIDFIGFEADDWCYIGVDESQIDEQVIICQNPITDESEIIIKDLNFKANKIIVSDITGKTIFVKRLNFERFPIGQYLLNQGFYYYKIISEDRKVISGKVIKL